jgi:hypothetical protein
MPKLNRQISIKFGVWRLRYNMGTDSILHSGPAQRLTTQRAQTEIYSFSSKTVHHTIRCITYDTDLIMMGNFRPEYLSMW